MSIKEEFFWIAVIVISLGIFAYWYIVYYLWHYKVISIEEIKSITKATKFKVEFKHRREINTIDVYKTGRAYVFSSQNVYYNEDGTRRCNGDKISEAIDIWLRAREFKSLVYKNENYK